MTRYEIDTPHSTIEFSVRHLVVSTVRGQFTNFAGLIDIDPDAITRSRVAVEVGAASITTGMPERDAHLRSEDFLDVATYPFISFKSQRIEEDGELLRVVGSLTLRDLTREVSLRVEPLGSVSDPYNKGRIAFAATLEIERRDFGLRWNQIFPSGGVLAGLVGERVSIALEVRAVRAAVRAAA